jgi:hypothetical protein
LFPLPYYRVLHIHANLIAGFPMFDLTGAEIRGSPVGGGRSLAGGIRIHYRVTQFVDSTKVSHHGWHLIVGRLQRPLP